MADPKIALASIGKIHHKRIGPPPMIEAIQQDLIRVNFDPCKASARLIRLAPKSQFDSSQLVFPPSRVSKIDMEVLEAESGRDTKASNSPHRSSISLSRKPWSTTSVSIAARKLSSLDVAASKASSLQLSASRKPGLGLTTQPKKGSGATGSKQPEFPPHGFRYHSNGDERVSRASSSTRVGSSSCLSCANHKAEEATISFVQLARLRDRILRTLPLSRDDPLLNLRSRTSGPELRAKRQQEEMATPGLVRLRKGTRSEPAVSILDRYSSTNTAARDTDNMFKRTILRHIHDMAQSGATPGRSHTRVTSALSNGMLTSGCACATSGGSRISLSRVASGSRSGRGQGGAQEEAAAEAPLGDCLTAGNSSFNMRYGVPVKLMALRKHILDEQHFRVLEEAQKNNAQIAQFLINVQRTVQESRQPGKQDKNLDLTTSPTIMAVKASN